MFSLFTYFSKCDQTFLDIHDTFPGCFLYLLPLQWQCFQLLQSPNPVIFKGIMHTLTAVKYQLVVPLSYDCAAIIPTIWMVSRRRKEEKARVCTSSLATITKLCLGISRRFGKWKCLCFDLQVNFEPLHAACLFLESVRRCGGRFKLLKVRQENPVMRDKCCINREGNSVRGDNSALWLWPSYPLNQTEVSSECEGIRATKSQVSFPGVVKRKPKVYLLWQQTDFCFWWVMTLWRFVLFLKKSLHIPSQEMQTTCLGIWHKIDIFLPVSSDSSV